MHLLDAPKGFVHGLRSVYGKVAHKKTDDPYEVPLFDSGLGQLGNWILDIAVVALIAVVVGAMLKWAYLAIFHK
jgi:hypothetical protein